MKFNSLFHKKTQVAALSFLIALVMSNQVFAQGDVTDTTTDSDVIVDTTLTEIVEPEVNEVFPPRPLSPEEKLSPVAGMMKRVNLKKPEVSIDLIGSVFLTSIEETAIINARKGLVTRMPTNMEFDEEQNLAGTKARPSGPRELALGGVLYVSPDDWIVWVNSEKITPKNIPSSIIDIRVSKDSVKLKWFDVQTNQIFPIKLRPHQRFNLDSRIFLPGSK